MSDRPSGSGRDTEDDVPSNSEPTGDTSTKDTSSQEDAAQKVAEEKRNLGDIMSDIFLPMLPALIAAGILQGITSVLVAFDWLQEGTSFHSVLTWISSAISSSRRATCTIADPKYA